MRNPLSQGGNGFLVILMLLHAAMSWRLAANEPSPAAQPGTQQPSVSRREIASLPLPANPMVHNSEAPVVDLALQALTNRLIQAQRNRTERDWKQAEKTLAGILASSEAPAGLQGAALLELGFTAQDQRQLPRAQQIFSQYVSRFKNDPAVPEILLRQGLIYRELGAPVMALSKFYAVISSALAVKLDDLAYYQRLVLQAQTEIAETYYLEGKFVESADYLGRLLKLDCRDLNREEVLLKLIRSWSAGCRPGEALAQAQLFCSLYPASADLPEVRFLAARALKDLGRVDEAHEQFIALLKGAQDTTEGKQKWAEWQQRTGNELANAFYKGGNFLVSLEIYLRLADLNMEPSWRLPALYQAGLIYERLKQPQKASDVYTRVLDEGLDTVRQKPSPSLDTLLEMTSWRKANLDWFGRAASANEELSRAAAPTRK